MTTAKPKVLDLDKLIPEKRMVRLAGKEFDVSQTPLAVTMKLASLRDNADTEAEITDRLEVVCEMVSALFSPSDPSATPEWVRDNISIQQMVALVDFIGEGLEKEAGSDSGVALKEGKGESSQSS